MSYGSKQSPSNPSTSPIAWSTCSNSDFENWSRRLCQQVRPGPRLCCLDPSCSVKLLLAEDDKCKQRGAWGLGERRALHKSVEGVSVQWAHEPERQRGMQQRGKLWKLVLR